MTDPVTRSVNGVVMAAATSHAPHISAFPDRAPEEQRAAVYSAMTRLGTDLIAAMPDLLVVVASDHFTNFRPRDVSQFLVGTNSTFDEIAEDWIGVQRQRVRGAPDFAAALVRAIEDVCSEACGQDLLLEHGVVTPLAWLDPTARYPLVPLLQNCIQPPLPSLEQCFTIGERLNDLAIALNRRIAVVGTGGLSHSPGAPDAGRIDQEFDRHLLRLLEAGDVDQILTIPNERIDRAGFGAWEIRQWATAFGAAAGAPADIYAYEPIPEWETGCAVARFRL